MSRHAPTASAAPASSQPARAHRIIARTVVIVLALVAACLPLVLAAAVQQFQRQKVWIDGFANAGVFILLALGLNIVVGLAGLLDLGYAAFFAIGAYTYAFGASPFTGARHPVLADAPRGRAHGRDVRHPAGRADAAAARRLPGDRDPRGSARSCRPSSSTLDKLDERHQRHRRRLPAEHPRLHLHPRRNPSPYYVTMVAILRCR